MKPYDHKKIEQKWRKVWDTKKVYQTLNAAKAKAKKMKPFYVLDMFPYPSGSGLHVGHPRGYIGSDVFARMKRMQGFNVLHPMGFDSFGLPAEQYAIQTGKNPGPFTNELVKRYREQLSILGFSFDWDRQVATHDPEYYKWTQWIFLQIYNSWYDAEKDKARPIAELVKKFASKGGDGFSAQQWKAFSEIEKQNILMNYRLAYQGYSEVNWCPELGTVLANDEIVERDGKMVSERGEFPVEKKSMRQWFMRITAYADRLLSGLESLDWPNNIKEIQKNWIGKSEGSEIDFDLVIKDASSDLSIKVFTTRADTLFGVTYVVLAPEHPLIVEMKHHIKNWNHVAQYIESVKAKSDEDRMDAGKEKTGVELHGVFAINPANGEQVPVWVADYVLANYGTGAVMAVPAHDERDFEFAKKYNLPIREVVSKHFILTGKHSEQEQAETVHRRVVDPIIHDNDDNYYLIKEPNGDVHFAGGGVDEGEEEMEALRREIIEETGFTDFEITKKTSPYITVHGFRYWKNKNQRSIGAAYEVVLNSSNRVSSEIEEGKFELVKVKKQDVLKMLSWEHHRYLFEEYLKGESALVDEGILFNSGNFNNLTSTEAKKAITEFVGGKLVTKYKMRDAIFARQRYWGEPIPLIHGADGGISEVSEKKLPLKLPNVKSYTPSGTGESPLATVSSWVKSGYETNTMPGWAGSSWYFLRYMDPKNKKSFADKKEIEYFKNVDMYVGGAEHATGHLLYSRFWNKVLKDLGYVKEEEPFKALRNQGMIGGADGRKMSKRWGNVVNPDDVVRDLGADTLRVYEAFMGPFEGSLPWSTDGIVGARRFVEKVWKLGQQLASSNLHLAKPGVRLDARRQLPNARLQKTLHKTIKKVSEDIQNFSFNTAISAMMICANEMEKTESIAPQDFIVFLKILAPFAPHVAEELYQEISKSYKLKASSSIHLSPWSKYDPKLIVDDEVTLGVQVNGKVRAEIAVARDATEADVKNMVMQIPDVVKWLDGREVRKFIYIPGKIISIVV